MISRYEVIFVGCVGLILVALVYSALDHGKEAGYEVSARVLQCKAGFRLSATECVVELDGGKKQAVVFMPYTAVGHEVRLAVMQRQMTGRIYYEMAVPNAP